MNYLTWIDADTNRARFVAIQPGWTTADIAQRLSAAFPNGIDRANNLAIRDAATLPPDHDFNRAWDIQGGNVVVNIVKARAFARRRIEAMWDSQRPRVRALRRAAQLLNDAAALAAADAEIAAWQAILGNAALDNAATIADLRPLIVAAEALMPPPGGPPN